MPPITGSADRLERQATTVRSLATETPAPQPAALGGPSGREIVDRHTQGGRTDTRAVAADLRTEMRARPQEATRLMMQALEQLKADDRDEVAQEFIRAHTDAELRTLGQTDAGRGALALAVNELSLGSVHSDEADDARRVGQALGVSVELRVNTGWAAISGVIHTVLDLAGFIPGLGAIPDLVNAGLYAIEGDMANAALSATAAVPIAGDGVKGASMVVRHGDEVLALGTQAARHGDEVAGAGNVLLRQGDEAIDAATATRRADIGPPGSASHKQARWEEYQASGGGWSYERWSTTYDNNVVRAREAHAAVDRYHGSLNWGQREVTVNTTVDGVTHTRRLDIADVQRQRGIEHKTGYQTADQANLWEIQRDRALVAEGWDIKWVFDGRASEPLQRALREAGIRIEFLGN